MQKKMEQIAERVKSAPVFPVANYKNEAELCIDCVDEIQKMIETENFQINTPINRRRATLFLVACYFCSTIGQLNICSSKEAKSIEPIYSATMR